MSLWVIVDDSIAVDELMAGAGAGAAALAALLAGLVTYQAPVAAAAAIERGHVTFDLHGRKLRGWFSLTEMRGRGHGQWLLVKSDDEFADACRRPVISQPESVKSGKRIGELTGEKDR